MQPPPKKKDTTSGLGRAIINRKAKDYREAKESGRVSPYAIILTLTHTDQVHHRCRQYNSTAECYTRARPRRVPEHRCAGRDRFYCWCVPAILYFSTAGLSAARSCREEKRKDRKRPFQHLLAQPLPPQRRRRSQHPPKIRRKQAAPTRPAPPALDQIHHARATRPARKRRLPRVAAQHRRVRPSPSLSQKSPKLTQRGVVCRTGTSSC